MEKETKVSVIMPIYNAQEYLRETLERITGQSLKEIEILCVNDGSTDDSETILKEYAQKDARVQLINQANQYAGIARNNGLSRAKGEYVVFWDADDIFDLQALEKLYAVCKEQDADICVCSAKTRNEQTGEVLPNSNYLMKKYLPEKRPFSRSDMPQQIFAFGSNVPWNKMYRRAFIEKHGLRFQGLKQANDTYFVLMAFFLAERISVTEEALVTYRIANKNSLSGKASETVFCAYESYLATWEELNRYEEFQKEVRKGFSARFFRGMIRSLNLQSSLESYRQLYEKISKEGLKKLEVTELKPEEFTWLWHYDACQRMQQLNADDYLMAEMQRQLQSISDKNAKLEQKNEKLREKNAKLQEKTEKIEELRGRVSELKVENKDLHRRSIQMTLRAVKFTERVLGKSKGKENN